MKKNTLYLFILLLITGLNTSCNYLDIVPDETATEKDAFANPRAALRYLYSCYGYLPQSNMVQSCMDFTGDETISPFAESYVKFAEGSYDSSNTTGKTHYTFSFIFYTFILHEYRLFILLIRYLSFIYNII